MLNQHYFPGRPLPEDDDGYFGRIAEIQHIEERQARLLGEAVAYGVLKALAAAFGR